MSIAHSEKIAALMGAMLQVQGQVDGVAKDAVNPHFKRRYASLESVTDAIREPCIKAGLVVTQAPGEFIDGTVAITTMIAHAASGEWMKSTLQLPVGKADPQGVGSALTYGARYSLMALFCLPPVDDDGEAAVRPPQRQERADPAPQRPAAGPVTQQIASSPLKSALAALHNNAADKAALVQWHIGVKERIAKFPPEDRDEFYRVYDHVLAKLEGQRDMLAGG